MKTIGLQVSEKIFPPISKLPYSHCTAVTASSCTPPLGRLLPIRTQYPPLPDSVSPRVLHLLFLFSSIFPLLRSSGLSLNHCSVRLVLAVGRSVLSVLISPFFTLSFGFSTTSPSASTPARLPTVKKDPRPPQLLLGAANSACVWLLRLYTSLRPFDLVPILHSVCRPVSFHRRHQYIGYRANRFH